MEGCATFEATKDELAKVDKQINGIINAITDGMYHPSMKQKMTNLEARKAELQSILANGEAPPPLLHPKMADYYRQQVSKLNLSLREEMEAGRMEAAEALRSLISRIVLTPSHSGMEVKLEGDLAGILNIAMSSRTNGGITGINGLSKRKNRPRGAAGLSELKSQLEMVAGAGFEPAAFRL